MPLEIPHHIIQAVKNGDKKSFGDLIDSCSQYVYGVAFKIIGEDAEAKDAAQESFIKVWEKIHTYKTHYKFTTWLYKIVMNSCLDRLRVRSRENKVFYNAESIDVLNLSSSGNTNSEFEEKQFAEFIRLISGKLSRKQHSVFVLHDLEDLNQDEISKILRMSKGRVKSNLYYARKTIRQLFISTEKAKEILSHGM